MFTLSNTHNLPESTISESGGVVQIDSRSSRSGGVISGGTSGIHEYRFTSGINIPDINAGSTQLTIVAQNNASLISGVWTKDIVGNSWNSAIKSVESYDASGVFAITWDIYESTGTIRQMGGIDNDPSQNDSYGSIENAIYQVNNRFYNYVYEKGSSVLTGPTTNDMYVSVGDRFGIEVVSGKVRYFVMKSSTIIYIYESLKTTSGTMHWKGAMNRGTDMSGNSKFNNVWVHQSTQTSTRSVSIEGVADALITDDDISSLADLGMVIQPGSTYSNIYYIRDTANAFVSGSGTYDIDMIHRYTAIDNQDSKIITHA